MPQQRRLQSPARHQHGRPPAASALPASTSHSPPPLSAAAVGAAMQRSMIHSVSGPTSLMPTSRGAHGEDSINGHDGIFGSHGDHTIEEDAVRVWSLLSGAELRTLSDVFYRQCGAHLTPTTLPAYLTSVGIQFETHPQEQGGASAAGGTLRDTILRAVELELAFRQAKTTTPQVSGAAAKLLPQHSGALHRALVKVLSARRLSSAGVAAPHGRLLSARASLLNTPKSAQLAGQHRHHTLLEASGAPPPKALPPTLSLDLTCWVARVLKDQANVRAAASSADNNPELLEAYRSCANEEGTVTVQSVKERCEMFEVQLSFGGRADAAKKQRRRLAAQQRQTQSREAGDDSQDEGSQDHHEESDPEEDAEAVRAANAAVLDAGQFAKLLRTKAHSHRTASPPRVGGLPGDKSVARHNAPVAPPSPSNSSNSNESSLSAFASPALHEPNGGDHTSIAPSPSNSNYPALSSRQQRLQQLMSTAPQSAGRPKSAATLSGVDVTPKRFVEMPYSEEELLLFEDAGGPALSPSDQHQTMLANTLLGIETCVRPSTLLRREQQRCQSAPLRPSGQLMGAVSTLNNLLALRTQPALLGNGSVMMGTSAKGQQAVLLQQDVDQSDVASLLAGASTVGGNGDDSHAQNTRAPPSDTGALPPPPPIMAAYFLPHADRVRPQSGRREQIDRSHTEDAMEVHQRKLAGDGRWPQSVASKRADTQGVAHMSLGTLNNFDWWPSTHKDQQRGRGGTHSLDAMVEAQDAAMKHHPARASLLGTYYHDVLHERGTATQALSGQYYQAQHRSSRLMEPDMDSEAPTGVGHQLDVEFPLQGGLTWSSSMEHRHHATSVEGRGVVARLTKHNSEQPAISLYRLQQHLTQLESSKLAHDIQTQKTRPTSSMAMTASQRLHKFRHSSSTTPADIKRRPATAQH